eukprot:scaffold10145_cov116-Isochrysis_galbana.AAC.3
MSRRADEKECVRPMTKPDGRAPDSGGKAAKSVGCGGATPEGLGAGRAAQALPILGPAGKSPSVAWRYRPGAASCTPHRNGLRSGRVSSTSSGGGGPRGHPPRPTGLLICSITSCTWMCGGAPMSTKWKVTATGAHASIPLAISLPHSNGPGDGMYVSVTRRSSLTIRKLTPRTADTSAANWAQLGPRTAGVKPAPVALLPSSPLALPLAPAVPSLAHGVLRSSARSRRDGAAVSR